MAYQNYYQPYQYGFLNQPQQPTTNEGIIWVQGEAGAKAYLVAPGNAVLLMDSESDKFYIKTVDQFRMPTMRVFSYTEITGGEKAPAAVTPNLSDLYVTRDEYNAFVQKMMKEKAYEQPETAARKRTDAADE